MDQTGTQNTTFTLLRTYYDAYRKMDDRSKLEYIDAIMSFGFEGQEPSFTEPMADLAFTLTRPTLENSVQYHTAQRENGVKGGRPRKKDAENNPDETQMKPNQNPNETQIKPNRNPNETEIKRESDSDSESNSESDNDNESKQYLSAAERQIIAPEAQKILCVEDPLEDFEHLWRAYPRKEDRPAALQAFLDLNLPSICLTPIVEAQKKTYAKQKRPNIPTLATWLKTGMYSGADRIAGKFDPPRRGSH